VAASFVAKRRRERFTDAARELDFELVEASGKSGLQISQRIIDAQAAAKSDRIEGDTLLDLFVFVLSVSIVDDSGGRPLDSDDGRKIVAEWPVDVLMAAGQLAMTVNGGGSTAKN
jgi:hypothetical protein